MARATNQLPVQTASPVELHECWGDYPNPSAFFAAISSFLFVDSEKLGDSSGVIFSDTQPSATDNAKIWLKTSEPYAVGFFAGGSYRLFYQYPPNVPLLFPQTFKFGGTTGNKIRLLTASEITGYGFSNPTNGAIWGIFEP